MRLYTPEQMAQMDAGTIKDIGIPGMVLMENAAIAVVHEVEKDLPHRGGKVILLAGKGNNGGDAFAAARHLYNAGADIKVYLLEEVSTKAVDAAQNLAILRNMGVPTHMLTSEESRNELYRELGTRCIVVDGLFGTGLKGDLSGFAAEVINAVNDSSCHVISIDIPSGVCGATGKIKGVCIRAHKTVTFAFPKPGLVMYPGREAAGELVIADIGIPSRISSGIDSKLNLIDEKLAAGLIPRRRQDSNKGSYGKLLIITGSTGMTGAGYLAGRSALKTGAGLVYLGVPASLANIYDTLLPETVTVPLEDSGRGYMGVECIESILRKLKNMDAAVIGPGMSQNPGVREIVEAVLKYSEIPLVADADALNAIAGDINMLKYVKCPVVLTPHPGEMARLVGISIPEVQDNRMEAARDFAQKWKVTVVLKGAGTVVAQPDGSIYVNSTGNSGMATAGTGDVLTGIIAGIAGQGAPLGDAAIAGVYVHGMAGDIMAGSIGEYGLTAGDVAGGVAEALKRLMTDR